ncbi:hypothetical protein HYPSUDRAFT_302503 [Hypholoma sublateritium FD-334 SS-4]|uniref:Uncharacterized protein n=1 Tax=Hypholoma sublateritium (strain FD-334 SS-4) TaxID=945553 RepID=A0A0D2NAP1_HYPSF|nr:hypothetical protein HYPSUDRAFT_302503 [Hypholoma sublateritium FD-334 SS-4]
MATTAPAVSAQPALLCDYCHQKPKFSNHSYCSKTCAAQAAALCNHCHKKPKFQNFEYCGKNCAALANPGGKTRNAGAAAPQHIGGVKKAGATANTQPSFDPMQIAKLVVQHIPQVQSLLNAAPQAAPAPPTQHIVANPFANPVNTQVRPPAQNSGPTNNPFLGPGPVYTQSAYQNPAPPAAVVSAPQCAAPTNGAVYLAPSAPPAGAQPLRLSTQEAADDLECLIPGCGKPVHRDAQGVTTSDYCSMRHREEAVASGYASPCIMCLTMPQSDTDYFCSRACREESLNKQVTFDAGEVADPQ